MSGSTSARPAVVRCWNVSCATDTTKSPLRGFLLDRTAASGARRRPAASASAEGAAPSRSDARLGAREVEHRRRRRRAARRRRRPRRRRRGAPPESSSTLARIRAARHVRARRGDGADGATTRAAAAGQLGHAHADRVRPRAGEPADSAPRGSPGSACTARAAARARSPRRAPRSSGRHCEQRVEVGRHQRRRLLRRAALQRVEPLGRRRRPRPRRTRP